MIETLMTAALTEVFSLNPSDTTNCRVCTKHGSLISSSFPSEISDQWQISSLFVSFSAALSSSASNSPNSSENSSKDSSKYGSKPGTIREPNALMLLLALSVIRRTILFSMLYCAVIASYSFNKFSLV